MAEETDIYNPTPEQNDAIVKEGNVIVSASAGSGKTTTMIQRIIKNLCEDGADVSRILAVTFTEKAAASMKRKLRSAVLDGIREAGSDELKKEKLKKQLDKIPAADISTIHAFCAHLIRRYFYLEGCSGDFAILADEVEEMRTQVHALDRLMDRLYERNDADLNLLLKYYSKKQTDSSLRELITAVYSQIRVVADYNEVLDKMIAKSPEAAYADALAALYAKSSQVDLVKKTEEFRAAVGNGEDAAVLIRSYENEMANLHDGGIFQALLYRLDAFEKGFITPDMCALDAFMRIIAESRSTLEASIQSVSGVKDCESDIVFYDVNVPIAADKASAKYKLHNVPMPKSADYKSKSDKELIRLFKGTIDNELTTEYKNACTHIITIRSVLQKYNAFRQTREIIEAFTHIIKQFDSEYALIKKEQNVLDFNDLEHFALDLMQRPEVKDDLSRRYDLVFVDEYQDVNPIQNRIISSICEPEGESGKVKCFYVGDEKQAIYGFRGSNSTFFKEKADDFGKKQEAANTKGMYHSLYMNDNFRSASEIVTEVNRIFEGTMTTAIHSVDYKSTSCMKAHDKSEDAAKEPGTYVPGGVELVVFGSNGPKEKADKVYSVRDSAPGKKISREGLAAVNIVQSCIGKFRYDPCTGNPVEIKQKDICILSRTWAGTEGMAHALSEYGYQVSGAKDENICNTPEVHQMLDILSYIDNANQDIPLISAMLSPIGKFTEDDLAQIRLASGDYDNGSEKDDNGYSRKIPFRECCEKYQGSAELKERLNEFFGRMKGLRKSAVILSAGSVIEKILGEYNFEEQYREDSSEAMDNIKRLLKEGADITIPALLKKISSAGNKITRPVSAPSDSIQAMTIHSAKGLEFPIVIIADICKPSGGGSPDIMFSEKYGLAPHYYDDTSMTVNDSVLTKLESYDASSEDNINELNLFYVACTRAKSKLYIMAEKMPPDYKLDKAKNHKNFATMVNFGLDSEECHIHTTDFSACSTDQLRDSLTMYRQSEQEAQTEKPSYVYSYDTSVPAKGSASTMVKDEEAENPVLHPGAKKEAEDTGSEDASDIGTAYHRFLEICDFSIKDKAGIQKELDAYEADGRISSQQKKDLDVANLAKIAEMKIFSCLEGADDVRREQSFYCPIPAKEYMSGTESDDEVIVQGAMDLLVKRDGKWQIIDYKYSDKSKEEIETYYAPQIRVYRQVLSRITGQAEYDIPATIVNIKNHFYVEM